MRKVRVPDGALDRTKYAAWLRASARPHPADEHCLVLVPGASAISFRVALQANMLLLPGWRHGPPRLPDDDELWEARVQQLAAAAAGDMRRVAEIHDAIEVLERELEVARSAVEKWQRADLEQLEQRIGWELAHAPYTDVLAGIQ